MDLTLPIPSEIEALLKTLQKSLKEILREDLIGIYITGSLAEGSFKEDTSDVDLLVILKNPINEETRENLFILHKHIREEFPKWAHRLECSYLPCSMLKNISPYPPLEARPYVNDGQLYKKDALYGFEWIINLYGWQRYGRALDGPSPQELIPSPIGIHLVQQASLLNFEKEWISLLKDPGYLKNPSHQVYAIDTICRTLYLASTGKVGSKPAATAWAKDTYPQWKSLIEAAESWKQDQPLEIVSDVQNFIKFTAEQLTLKKEPSPAQ